MERNLKFASWSIKIWGREAVIFSPTSAETHYLEPLAFAVYRTCHDNPCSTLDTIAATLAVHRGISLTPSFHELVGESLDRLRRIGLLHTT